MTRVWVKDENSAAAGSHFLRVGRTFLNRGYAMTRYGSLVPANVETGDIVVGGVQDVRSVLPNLPDLDYPEELWPFLYRGLRKGQWKDVLLHVGREETPFFAKPLNHKAFPGKLFTGFEDLLDVSALPSNMEVWISDPVEFVTEWRVFVLKGEILNVSHYKGDPLMFPTVRSIDHMIRTYESAPVAYSLDVGVLESGVTALVEVNLPHCLGIYGLPIGRYLDMLEAAWSESWDKGYGDVK